MDMKQQRFGIEIELTGIARKRGAEIAAAYFGTQSYYEGTYYDTYVALDSQGREWKFMSDASIKPERKEGKSRVAASDSYKTEMVSPICRYRDHTGTGAEAAGGRSPGEFQLWDPCAYRCLTV